MRAYLDRCLNDARHRPSGLNGSLTLEVEWERVWKMLGTAVGLSIGFVYLEIGRYPDDYYPLFSKQTAKRPRLSH